MGKAPRDHAQPCHQLVWNLCSLRPQSAFKALCCLWQMKIVAFPFYYHRNCMFGTTWPSLLRAGWGPAYDTHIVWFAVSQQSRVLSAWGNISINCKTADNARHKIREWFTMEGKFEDCNTQVTYLSLFTAHVCMHNQNATHGAKHLMVSSIQHSAEPFTFCTLINLTLGLSLKACVYTAHHSLLILHILPTY